MWAKTQPDKLAAIHNGSPVTYTEFARSIDATQQYLKKANLPQAQTAIVVIYNLLDAWIACLALRAEGLNTVCVPSAAVAEKLNLVNVCCVVTSKKETFTPTIDTAPWPAATRVVLPVPQNSSDHTKNLYVAEQASAQGGHILFTSGTTGVYKKLFLSAALQDASNTACADDYTPESVFHCVRFGLWTGVGFKYPQRYWQSGGCVIFDQRDDWYRYFLDAGMSQALLLPETVNQLLEYCEDEAPSERKRAFSLLVGGGFLSYNKAEKLLNRVSENLEIVFGITELSIIALSAKVNEPQDMLWFQASKGRTVQVVDENDNLCPAGGEGFLRICLCEYDVSCYLDDPTSSAQFFRNGFFYPGDMAIARADGCIRPLGRKLDVIIVGGQKMASAPLELTLQNMLDADAVCVFSGADSTGRQELVVAVKSDTVPPESILISVSDELRIFENVRFAFTREFPLTETGTQKIDRVALRRLLFSPVEEESR
jgi:acyl-coenzyme A synthetase/AMP-(fatty) acid ligase